MFTQLQLRALQALKRSILIPQRLELASKVLKPQPRCQLLPTLAQHAVRAHIHPMAILLQHACRVKQGIIAQHPIQQQEQPPEQPKRRALSQGHIAQQE